MAQIANAPRRRNRGRAGEKRQRREAYFSVPFNDAIERARIESGGLSLALYIEQTLGALMDEDGKLPVLPKLDAAEVVSKAAA